MKRTTEEKLNAVLNKYGYTVIEIEYLEELKNKIASLNDFINLMEGEKR